MNRFGVIDLPEKIKDSKTLVFASPNLINTKNNTKVDLEIFAYKSQEIYIQRKIYHVKNI